MKASMSAHKTSYCHVLRPYDQKRSFLRVRKRYFTALIISEKHWGKKQKKKDFRPSLFKARTPMEVYSKTPPVESTIRPSRICIMRRHMAAASGLCVIMMMV